MARMRDDEQGAVLAIVGISLLVLLGMLVLTFDLGRGVSIKRNAVNAADSAALAAAMECGLANGEASARGAADDLVGDNNETATVTGFQIDPDPAVCSGAANPDPDGKNTVTVTVSVPQDYVFAPIFGFDNGTVVASATAEWTLEVSNPAPLKLEALPVEECLRGGSGSHCYMGFDNDGAAQWGWLNFPEGWPEKGEPNPPAACPSTGGANDLQNYVGSMGMGTSGGFHPVLWTIPIWVCAKDGDNRNAQIAIQTWIEDPLRGARDPRPIVSFPVVAPEDPPCPAPPLGCFPRYGNPNASYPVIGFQGFYIEGLWKGNEIRQAGLKEECGFEQNVPGRAFCIELTVVDAEGNNPNGFPTVRLID